MRERPNGLRYYHVLVWGAEEAYPWGDTVAGDASSGRERQGWPTAAMGCPLQDKPAALIGCPADTLIWDGAKRQNPNR
jgi:hypothetical protein